jgi:hypothetical protein
VWYTARATFDIWYQLQDLLQEQLKPAYRPIYLRLLQVLLDTARLSDNDWFCVLAGVLPPLLWFPIPGCSDVCGSEQTCSTRSASCEPRSAMW